MKISSRLLAALLLLTLARCKSEPGSEDMEPFDEPDLAEPADLLPAPDLTSTVLLKTTGFDVPESAYWHAATGSWFVSNISITDFSKLATKDMKGSISKLDADGKVVEAKWVEGGLSSPLGIRGTGDQLVVANIDELVMINVMTKAVTRTAVAGALMLNDVDVAGDGTIYATDTFGNAVWSYKAGGAAQKVFSDAQLNLPNGILVAGGRLLIASTGPFDKPAELGELWGYNLESKALTRLGFQGKLDGMEIDGASLLISENPTARVYGVTTGQAPFVVRDLRAQDGLISAGDIGFDPERRILAVPDLSGGSVTFVRVP